MSNLPPKVEMLRGWMSTASQQLPKARCQLCPCSLAYAQEAAFEVRVQRGAVTADLVACADCYHSLMQVVEFPEDVGYRG